MDNSEKLVVKNHHPCAQGGGALLGGAFHITTRYHVRDRFVHWFKQTILSEKIMKVARVVSNRRVVRPRACDPEGARFDTRTLHACLVLRRFFWTFCDVPKGAFSECFMRKRLLKRHNFQAFGEQRGGVGQGGPFGDINCTEIDFPNVPSRTRNHDLKTESLNALLTGLSIYRNLNQS